MIETLQDTSAEAMESIAALFDIDQDYFLLKACLCVVIVCQLIAYMQVETLQIHHSKSNKLMTDFVAKTQVSQMKYRPWLFALNPIS